MEKKGIVEGWIQQYNDPNTGDKIRQVLKHQILDHLEQEKQRLEEDKKAIIEKIRKVRQGNMLEEAAENIGVWYENGRDFFKILKIEGNEVKALFSENYEEAPTFKIAGLYEHEWRDAKRYDTIPEEVQNRIDKLNEMLR